MIAFKRLTPKTRQVNIQLPLVSQALQCLQEVLEFPLITEKSN